MIKYSYRIGTKKSSYDVVLIPIKLPTFEAKYKKAQKNRILMNMSNQTSGVKILSRLVAGGTGPGVLVYQ